ncbi:MAG: GmrSD restriction endonuclease domain-containing protein, partial [Rectinema subterraneum]|uniref:GmrSD restriction endonuclease domain-containing protein n=1 Tax=Rectinema subterraneum TaxID=2653714 RepID=UPI003C7D2C2C
MIIQQYSVNQHPIQLLLSWVQSKEIAIPEIQRPFVWDSTQVRDFMDSLYRGYPVGYLIAWRNPNVRLKDGSMSSGKRILIDGQQRITALMAALLGQEVIDKDYKSKRISIAFNPIQSKFEVTNPAIRKDKSWISDISAIFESNFRIRQFADTYIMQNSADQDLVYDSIESLRGIVNNSIGLIELNSDLDIDTVTEIFVRINSAGVVLSQADFAMSKIAVNEKYGGNILRKAIDYFCHMAVTPEFCHQLHETDREFTQTEYFQKMSWLKNENDDLYDPSYIDMLRVAFTYKFKRGRLQDLVALLSGRNFETRGYEEAIAEDSFSKLSEGIKEYMNENNFKRFVMILRSAGFIDSSMMRSQNAIDFSYVLYLALRELDLNQAIIESLVRKWFVLSVLTSRYSASPESQFDFDIKRIAENPESNINDVIEAELSDAFWNLALPQQMNTSVASSPSFNVFLAAQVKMNDRGFLSKDITVRDLILLKGDVHHIFPREYLKKQGYNRGIYNQIANYVMAQSEINIAIGSKAPNVYFKELLEQCNGGNLKYGGIASMEELQENLKMHCIPERIVDMDASRYNEFLEARRKLMAMKIKEYFSKL